MNEWRKVIAVDGIANMFTLLQDHISLSFKMKLSQEAFPFVKGKAYQKKHMLPYPFILKTPFLDSKQGDQMSL
jgi:hypothetical protein